MDCTAFCKTSGLVMLGKYSTTNVAVAKLTAAATTPFVLFTILSTLTAQEAQVMFKTGNVFFMVVTP